MIIGALLTRLEERAISVHDLERELEEREEKLREERRHGHALQAEIDRLNTLTRFDYGRVCRDIISLLDRDNLSDAEKLQSISGLIDQVSPNRKPKPPAWYVAAQEAEAEQAKPQTDAAQETSGAPAAGQPSLSPNPARRTTKRG